MEEIKCELCGKVDGKEERMWAVFGHLFCEVCAMKFKDYIQTTVDIAEQERYKAGEMAKTDDVLDKVKDEIVEEFGGCAICEWNEDFDWDENDISEWQKVGSINDILQIIDKLSENGMGEE